MESFGPAGENVAMNEDEIDRNAPMASRATPEPQTPEGRIFSGEAWRDFCRRLSLAGDAVLRPEAPASMLNRAEGFRYLTRLLRIGLIQNLEAADPDFPFFYRPADEITKYGGDNPDNVYWSAMVRGDRDYRITGTRGTMYYFSIGSKAFRMEKDGTIESTGELNGADMKWASDGRFEIVVSSKQPNADNWLPMSPETNFLLMRQTYLDRATEIPGSFKIERIGGPTSPAPLDPQFLETALRRTADFVHGNALKFGDWLPGFQATPNQMPQMDQERFWKAGGDPLLRYHYGYFRLAADEAWVIRVIPPECIYWSFALYDWWLETLDYRYHRITVNKHSAKLNDDGSLTLQVVAAYATSASMNWIDTAGHLEGLALFRWLGAPTNPEADCRVIKLSDLQRR